MKCQSRLFLGKLMGMLHIALHLERVITNESNKYQGLLCF